MGSRRKPLRGVGVLSRCSALRLARYGMVGVAFDTMPQAARPPRGTLLSVFTGGRAYTLASEGLLPRWSRPAGKTRTVSVQSALTPSPAEAGTACLPLIREADPPVTAGWAETATAPHLPGQPLDPWVVPPDTALQRKRGRGAGRRTDAMTQQLVELVEQFCHFQHKQRGKSERGVQTYRWVLERCLGFVKRQRGRMARASDLTPDTIQAWMDEMAGANLALETLRVRQSVLSSFCAWLVKRQVLPSNPVARLDRPPHRREAPTQVPGPPIMDALVQAARQRSRPRDVALFLILRYTGMRRESVATLQVRHLDATWGLRGVRVKGGKTRDIPVPTAVTRFLQMYVEQVLAKELEAVTPDTPLFWSTWGRRSGGKTRAPMTGQNIWRLCKVYGRLIGYPMLKPHDLRHGVALEVLEQHHDLEEVRALLGHARIDTTQIYTTIRPPQLKRAMAFYEEKAEAILTKQ